MKHFKGSCHCGNVQVEVDLSGAAETYKPRACDCDFCRLHGASYLSDSQGALQITAKKEMGRYRQGSGSAEFLLCPNCGVLIGVVYSEAGRTWGAINSSIVATEFGEKVPVSPKTLSAAEKTARWKEVWFKDVKL